jgi:hypothetical protein
MPDDVMFAPLTAEDISVTDIGGAPARSKSVPILPVPVGAPPCCWRHPQYGSPTSIWEYRNLEGLLMAYAARVEYVGQDGNRQKDVFPLTYCRVDDGERTYLDWRACGLPSPRPLYSLPQLVASMDATVIVTEGEKKSDAVASLFPGYIGTTSMGGAHAAKKSDWAPPHRAQRHYLARSRRTRSALCERGRRARDGGGRDIRSDR